MSDFERFRKMIEDSDKRATERDASTHASLERIEIESRWKRELASEARNACEILMHEIQPETVFRKVDRELLHANSVITSGKLTYVPWMHSKSFSGGDKGGRGGTTFSSDPDYWMQEMVLSSSTPSITMRVVVAARGPENYPVSSRVGYELTGSFDPYKSNDWKNLTVREMDDLAMFGYTAGPWVRIVRNDKRGWAGNSERGELPFSREKYRYGVIDVANAREDFEEVTGRCTYELLAKLKGIKP